MTDYDELLANLDSYWKTDPVIIRSAIAIRTLRAQVAEAEESASNASIHYLVAARAIAAQRKEIEGLRADLRDTMAQVADLTSQRDTLRAALVELDDEDWLRIIADLTAQRDASTKRETGDRT